MCIDDAPLCREPHWRVDSGPLGELRKRVHVQYLGLVLFGVCPHLMQCISF
ncbi:hypothetical protein HETIRDRAFT_172473 [Heterobasidion irregulare TC 32-1]|uniref:Uncharacterized protein n=1 Tax=Heterobasidion irregulare (strain TC 32-1) TaxID=747525 RepID=W4JZK7_HETIT|nr:uncharacterized protein HETIRDRAFT_172473 [Heterobasidion irregulare TC 32-1]ETW78904.1 hypothetical protein HETIRDRAFT_172473 [Heterobasidion irregulare TC 32-1]